MRFEGKLKSWNDERGFGFIEPLQGGQDIFVHIKSLPPRAGRPMVGLPLSFEVEAGPQGKKRAKSVELIRSGPMPSARRRTDSPAPWSLARLAVIPLFALVYAIVAWRWTVSHWVIAAYGLASLIAFTAYAVDKAAARAGRWRTPESTLHGLSLLGGWPGALLAQQLLRHKVSKPAFVATFWATVLLNVGVFLAWNFHLHAR